MKYAFAFLIAFILSNPIEAQSRHGYSLPDSAIVAITSISGILYCGMDNHLNISNIDSNGFDTLLLKTNNGKIYSDSTSIIANPRRTGKARMHVYGIKGRDTIQIGYQNLTVKSIPEIKLSIDTLALELDDRISKTQFLLSDSLSVWFTRDIPGSYNWFSISRFSIGYSYGGFYVEHVNHSNQIDAKSKQIVESLGPGKKITIQAKLENKSDIKKELPLYRIELY